MKYDLFINKFGFPDIRFEDPDSPLLELCGLETPYLTEIVNELENVLDGKTANFSFGREVYLLECDANTCKVLDTFGGWMTVLEITTLEIYELMKEWKQYRHDFMQETGKEI